MEGFDKWSFNWIAFDYPIDIIMQEGTYLMHWIEFCHLFSHSTTDCKDIIEIEYECADFKSSDKVSPTTIKTSFKSVDKPLWCIESNGFILTVIVLTLIQIPENYKSYIYKRTFVIKNFYD